MSPSHAIVFALRPKNQKTKSTTYWVAVLKSIVQPATSVYGEEDFLWIKCHGSISVKTIYEQYTAKLPEVGDVKLKLGSKFPSETTPIRDLDEFNDRLVVFEPLKDSDQSARASVERVPLQPIQHQVTVKPDSEELSSKIPANIPKYQGLNPAPQDENIKPAVGHVAAPPISPHRPLPPVVAQLPPYNPAPHQPGGYQPPLCKTPYLEPSPPLPPTPCSTAAHPADASPVAPPDSSQYVASATPEWAISQGFDIFADRHQENYRLRDASLDAVQIRNCLYQEWLHLTPAQRQTYENYARNNPQSKNPSVKFEPIKANLDMKDVLPVGDPGQDSQQKMDFQLQSLLKDATPEQLEASVAQGLKLLVQLKVPMSDEATSGSDAAQWVLQIDNLRKQAVKTKTIIGVVGNTGAGKSSVINALLDEERIIPTNCMRACTAVVTEISYNDTEIPYHAQIEFIQVADWEKELKTLFQDLFDPAGHISREATNPDSDAGIAYAKIKAVYPKKTKEDIANSSVEQMVKDVSHILGTEREIKETDSLKFYKKLQHFVDSKEKSTGETDKDKKKAKKELEFWPLIRVVRIHLKSPALSTGAVIVDLPGVHDSNAARAAVAENYMKQCTGLWIVAPINRAVDDKAAKSLLGESFKRQLKMDGGFSTVTFICSKTDDISLMEAQDSLGLDDEMGQSWQEIDELNRRQKSLETEIKDIRETSEILNETFNHADEQLEVWEGLKDSLEDGNTVFAPNQSAGKKRKNNCSPKRRKKLRRDSDSDHGFIDDDYSEHSASESETEQDSGSAEFEEPLTEESITAKIEELRSIKKEARKQRADIAGKIKELQKEKSKAETEEENIEAEMSALCISGRNQYSKGAIQQDFAQGIRELDQELAAEEDEENFNPDADTRDYEEVARSLPVFCVSSRGYQKLQGRLKKDPKIPGFKALEETEIPQLQAHCKQLTVAGRTSNCKRFINNLSQLLNSLSIWAANDGTSTNMTADQRRREEKYLQKGLKELETGLDRVVVECCSDVAEAIKDNIFDKYEPAIKTAAHEANKTCLKWGSKVNREDRAAGGYCWSTYKAICRRNGEYSNAQGPHQWNFELIEPMMKILASGWERTFTRRMPTVLASFIRNAGGIIRAFHRDVSSRAVKVGAGLAGLHMLQQQLGVYESLLKDLMNIVKDVINTCQKDINREFTPIVADHMVPAYEGCTQESGPGSYARMKMIMNTHVEHERGVMFGESAEAAQKRLEALVKQVEAMMSERVMEVFVAMRRDYRSVLGGAEETQGELLPKAQRLMRKEIMRILEDIERMFTAVLDGKVGENSDLGEEGVKKETGEVHSTMDEFGDSSISDEAFNSWIDEGTSLKKTNPNTHVPASEEKIGLAEPSAASSASNSHPPRATSNAMGTLSPRVGPSPCPEPPHLQKGNSNARNLAAYYETEDENKYQPSSPSRDSTPAFAN